MDYKINGSKIIAVIGESAKMNVQKAVTYIESGKAELSPLVAAAKGYKESAETAAGEALNSAERAEAAASSIPTVNDATLTIQVNSVDLQTFTANSATNATANIVVPTDTGDLTNGAGFITSSALSGYATQNWVTSQGYTTNIGTVTSVNNTSPDGAGNVSLTIPTVNNGVLTIQKNGVQLTTFSANQSANATVNMTVPTDTGDLTNGAGYITSSAIANMQTTTNLVTSVSSASTDTQYPSAKLFYDTCGDIETLINAL